MAAEVLSVLSGDAFTRVSQAHDDSVRDGAHFTVVRNDMAAYKLYIEDPQYGGLGCDHVDFEGTVGRRYLRALHFGYAASLGLVEVRYVDSHVALDDYADFWGTEQLTRLSRYDGLRAVRLPVLGKRVAVRLWQRRLFRLGRTLVRETP